MKLARAEEEGLLVMELKVDNAIFVQMRPLIECHDSYTSDSQQAPIHGYKSAHRAKKSQRHPGGSSGRLAPDK